MALQIPIVLFLCIESLLLTSCGLIPPEKPALTVEPYAVFSSSTEYVGVAKDKIVCIDGVSGELLLADAAGNVVSTQIVPSEVTIMGEIICAEEEEEQFYYFDADGNRLDSSEFARPDMLTDLDGRLNLARYGDELWGYVDQNGRWVLEPNYMNPTDFNDGYALVDINQGRDKGIRDENGTSTKIDIFGYPPEGSTFHDSRLLLQISYVDIGDKQCTFSTFVTTDGQVLPSEFEAEMYEQFYYNKASDISCGLAAVQVKGGKWGYINVDGECVIEPQFYEAYPFVNNYAIVKTDESSFSLIDQKGKQVQGPIELEGYSSTGEIADGLFVIVDSNRKKTLASFTEGVVLRADATLLYFDYPVWETEKGCYIPMTDEFVPGYMISTCDDAFVIDNGLSCSLRDINTGEIRTELPIISPFSEGYAKARNEDGYWGYINSQGEWVIPAQYKSASDVKNGIAFVDTGEQCGLIKVQG